MIQLWKVYKIMHLLPGRIQANLGNIKQLIYKKIGSFEGIKLE